MTKLAEKKEAVSEEALEGPKKGAMNPDLNALAEARMQRRDEVREAIRQIYVDDPEKVLQALGEESSTARTLINVRDEVLNKVDLCVRMVDGSGVSRRNRRGRDVLQETVVEALRSMPDIPSEAKDEIIRILDPEVNEFARTVKWLGDEEDFIGSFRTAYSRVVADSISKEDDAAVRSLYGEEGYLSSIQPKPDELMKKLIKHKDVNMNMNLCMMQLGLRLSDKDIDDACDFLSRIHKKLLKPLRIGGHLKMEDEEKSLEYFGKQVSDSMWVGVIVAVLLTCGIAAAYRENPEYVPLPSVALALALACLYGRHVGKIRSKRKEMEGKEVPEHVRMMADAMVGGRKSFSINERSTMFDNLRDEKIVVLIELMQKILNGEEAKVSLGENFYVPESVESDPEDEPEKEVKRDSEAEYFNAGYSAPSIGE